jgi:signal-transduction protein with cAMP-binding, CBS, and nucleotidyltransferase domain
MYLIKDLMTSPAISVDIQTTVEVAAKLMCEKEISSLLVKQEEEYVGIITKTDLVKRIVANGLDPKTTAVNFVMSKPLKVLDQFIDPVEANEFMLRNKIKHLVVTLKGKVQGVMTAKDMVS